MASATASPADERAGLCRAPGLRPAQNERLLRYDALLDLFARLRRQQSLDGIAEAAAAGWRYCVSLAGWKLVVEDHGRLIVMSADAGGPKVVTLIADQLGDFERRHRERRVPALMPASAAGPLDFSGPDGQLAVLPLGSRSERARALLFAVSATPVFSKIDLKFLDAAGSFLAGEIDALRRQERLTEFLRNESLRDGLTGIANRLCFDRRIAAAWADAGRTGEPLSLVMVDIDHFKPFNDHFGHLAGDDCLKSVAMAIESVARRRLDVAARIGGEEFAVIMPRTDESGALHAAESIRLAIQALAIPHIVGGRQTIVTASVGCATIIPDGAEGPDGLRRAADAALYAAKRGGRDRSVGGRIDRS